MSFVPSGPAFAKNTHNTPNHLCQKRKLGVVPAGSLRGKRDRAIPRSLPCGIAFGSCICTTDCINKASRSSWIKLIWPSRLQKDLATKFDAWLDSQRLSAGDIWSREIEQAIDRADVVLALLSAGSFTSDICRECPCFSHKKRSVQEFLAGNALFVFNDLCEAPLCTATQIERLPARFVHGQSELVGRRSESVLE